jgi:hypothetical protein
MDYSSKEKILWMTIKLRWKIKKGPWHPDQKGNSKRIVDNVRVFTIGHVIPRWGWRRATMRRRGRRRRSASPQCAKSTRTPLTGALL